MVSVPREQRETIAKLLQSELADRQMTQEAFAALTQKKAYPGVETSTIQRALHGSILTRKTLKIFEKTLDISLEEPVSLGQSIANEIYGGYTYNNYSHYIGDYICVRAAFKQPSELCIYHLSIDWDRKLNCLRFNDRNQHGGDYGQNGPICMPVASQYLHFLTHYKGMCRLITVTHLTGTKTAMRGAMLTTYDNDPEYRPAVSPIIIEKLSDEDPKMDLNGFYDRRDPKVSELANALEEWAQTGVVVAFG
jgi:hypothetical protein